MVDQIIDGVEPRQEQAIIALLNEVSIKRAADAAGIGERTLHKWLTEPGFQAAYRKARRLAFAHAISLTQRYAPMAVNTLAKVMSDPQAPHSARVNAAEAILRFSRDSIELDDLEARIEALEQTQQGPVVVAEAKPIERAVTEPPELTEPTEAPTTSPNSPTAPSEEAP